MSQELQQVLEWVNRERAAHGKPTLAMLPTGIPCDPEDCVIARGLDAAFVCSGTATLDRYDDESLDIKLPAYVERFIMDFDRGAYPDLIDQVPA